MMKRKFPIAVFKSGFSVSIQANQGAYCHPRNNFGPYTACELGYPSEPEPLISEWAEDPGDPTGTVYGWVPAGIIMALLVKHGGLVNEDQPFPKLHMDTEQSHILTECLCDNDL